MNKIGFFALTAVSLLAFCVVSPAGNLILNGDFDNNTAGTTQFNVSNAAFNGFMADATAFGTAQEIDIIKGTDYLIPPESGNWKLGIATNFLGEYDAFSLSLSSALVAGNNYRLQFFGALEIAGFPSEVAIGVSSSATDFGTQIFSGTPTSPDAWTQFDVAFQAPINASYITVLNLKGYTFVDNFSIDGTSSTPEPSSLFLLGTGVVVLAGATSPQADVVTFFPILAEIERQQRLGKKWCFVLTQHLPNRRFKVPA
jgi:hypothetical protein